MPGRCWPEARLYHLTVRRKRRRIHAELCAGGDGVTVTDVALRWGVTHTGRFAQEYRRMSGQPPSQTLRRGC